MNEPYLLDSECIVRDAADYLLKIQDDEGFCIPVDSKHEENAVYHIGTAVPLLEAYAMFGDNRCLEAARRTLDRAVASQAEDGSIPFDMLPPAYYERAKTEVMEYTIEPLVKGGQTYPGSTIPVAEYAAFGLTDGLLALAAAAYGRADDDRYAAAGRRALDHYCAIWDPERLKAHHFMSFFGIAFAMLAFSNSQHERRDEMRAATTALLTEGPAWWDYSPSKLAIAGGCLLAVHGSRYAASHIVPGIDKLLAAGLEVMPGGFGMATADSQWGDYADMRGSVPMAMVMQACDAVAGTGYTETAAYDRLTKWMADNRRAARDAGRPFYEVSHADGRRFGSGTPTCLLPTWWATGRFSP